MHIPHSPVQQLKALVLALLFFVPSAASAENIGKFVWHYEDMGFVAVTDKHVAVLIVEDHAGPGHTSAFAFNDGSQFKEFGDLWNKAKKLPANGEIGRLKNISGGVLTVSIDDGLVKISVAEEAQDIPDDCRLFKKDIGAFDKCVRKVSRFLRGPLAK